jgi:hypothetical protein
MGLLGPDRSQRCGKSHGKYGFWGGVFFSFGGQGISILGFLYSDLFCDAKPDEAANGFLSMPACVIG